MTGIATLLSSAAYLSTLLAILYGLTSRYDGDIITQAVMVIQCAAVCLFYFMFGLPIVEQLSVGWEFDRKRCRQCESDKH